MLRTAFQRMARQAPKYRQIATAGRCIPVANLACTLANACILGSMGVARFPEHKQVEPEPGARGESKAACFLLSPPCSGRIHSTGIWTWCVLLDAMRRPHRCSRGRGCRGSWYVAVHWSLKYLVTSPLDLGHAVHRRIAIAALMRYALQVSRQLC
jgi:hypothetical protein